VVEQIQSLVTAKAKTSLPFLLQNILQFMPGQIKLMLLKPELLLASLAKVTCVLIFFILISQYFVVCVKIVHHVPLAVNIYKQSS